MIRRIIGNTKKQITRSGWAGWGSIAIMTMAFLVATIFGGLAYLSNLYINFIERKSNLIVFFEIGMNQEIIDELSSKWEQDPKIKSISFTTEEEAYELYSDYSSRVEPVRYVVLRGWEEKRLQSSLDIQLWSLDDLEDVKRNIQRDIEAQLDELKIVDTQANTTADEEAVAEDEAISDEVLEVDEEETVVAEEESETAEETTDEEAETAEEVLTLEAGKDLIYEYQRDPETPPIVLKVDDENLEQLREFFFFMRIGGIFFISVLFVVIFFFTFMTVEFRLSNQQEEIGVMQLVGGSLGFIRAPYILEGGYYGFIGSLISSLLIGGVLTFIFVLNKNSQLTHFIIENFEKLDWPTINSLGWAALIFGLAFAGFLLGAMSSYLSIRRYIR